MVIPIVAIVFLSIFGAPVLIVMHDRDICAYREPACGSGRSG